MVVNSPGVVVARTDVDMVDEVNYRLKVQNLSNKMISQRSYERYKAKMLSNSVEELTEDMTVGNAIVIERFWRLIKAKIRMEKLTILAHLSIDAKRQRWAWLLERKFRTEWAIPGPWTKHVDDDKEDDTAINEVEVTIVVPERV